MDLCADATPPYGPISRHREDDPLEFTFLDRSLAFVPHYNTAPVCR